MEVSITKTQTRHSCHRDHRASFFPSLTSEFPIVHTSVPIGSLFDTSIALFVRRMFEPPKSLPQIMPFAKWGGTRSATVASPDSAIPLLAATTTRSSHRILPDCRLTCRRCAYPLDASNYIRQL
jgi:hypothetical protein